MTKNEDLKIWCEDRYETINMEGLALARYGIPFFANSSIGLPSLAILSIFIKEPEGDGLPPSSE